MFALCVTWAAPPTHRSGGIFWIFLWFGPLRLVGWVRLSTHKLRVSFVFLLLTLLGIMPPTISLTTTTTTTYSMPDAGAASNAPVMTLFGHRIIIDHPSNSASVGTAETQNSTQLQAAAITGPTTDAPELDQAFARGEIRSYTREYCRKYQPKDSSNEKANYTFLDGGSVFLGNRAEVRESFILNYARDVVLGKVSLFVSQCADTYYRLFFELDGYDGERWPEDVVLNIAQNAQQALKQFVHPQLLQTPPENYLCISTKYKDGSDIRDDTARIHLVWPQVIVHNRLHMYIWEAFCTLLEQNAPRRISAHSPDPKEFWKNVVDASAMNNAKKVNLRMNFSHKTGRCPQCVAVMVDKNFAQGTQEKSTTARRRCNTFALPPCTNTECLHNGNAKINGTYQLFAIMNGAGEIDADLTAKYKVSLKDRGTTMPLHELYLRIAAQVRITQIHTLSTRVSKWLSIPPSANSPFPCEKVDMGNNQTEWSSDHFPHDLKVLAASDQYKSSEKVEVNSEIGQRLQQYIRTNLIAQWQQLKIYAIKRHKSALTKEWLYYVSVTGNGRSYCLNRKPDAEGHCCHSSNSIYFQVSSKGFQQRCFSTAAKPGMRVWKANCKDFASKPYPLSSKLRELMFRLTDDGAPIETSSVPKESYIARRYKMQCIEAAAQKAQNAAANGTLAPKRSYMEKRMAEDALHAPEPTRPKTELLRKPSQAEMDKYGTLLLCSLQNTGDLHRVKLEEKNAIVARPKQEETPNEAYMNDVMNQQASNDTMVDLNPSSTRWDAISKVAAVQVQRAPYALPHAFLTPDDPYDDDDLGRDGRANKKSKKKIMHSLSV